MLGVGPSDQRYVTAQEEVGWYICPKAFTLISSPALRPLSFLGQTQIDTRYVCMTQSHRFYWVFFLCFVESKALLMVFNK